MSDYVTVWGINGIEMELEEKWVNPMLETGAITLEPPAPTEPEPEPPVKVQEETLEPSAEQPADEHEEDATKPAKPGRGK